MNRFHTRNAICGTALLVFALAPAAPAVAKSHPPRLVTISGIVVHENDAAHSFVVAERSGRLDAVHGRRLAVGEKVRVRVSELANGTFASREEHVVARPAAHELKIEGVVSAEDPAAHEVVVSGSGTSIPVETGASSGDLSPSIGDDLSIKAEVEPDGVVKAERVTDTGHSSSFRVEGKVLSTDDQARTLTISGDDNNETGQAVTVTLPASFDITAFAAGDCVELTVTKAADGGLTAIQSFGDNSRSDANNARGRGRDRGGPSGDPSAHNDGSDHHGSPAPGDQTGSGSGSGSAGHDSPASGEQSGSGSGDEAGSSSGATVASGSGSGKRSGSNQ